MNTVYKNILWPALASLLLLASFGCQKDDDAAVSTDGLVKNENADVPLAWMDLFLEIDRHTSDFRPGPAARALAYMNIAAYESVMKGMPEFKSLGSLYNGLDIPATSDNNLYYPVVVNTVYANLFKRYLPTGYLLPDQQTRLQFEILALEDSLNETYRNNIGTSRFERSVARGQEVADAVWEWSKGDSFGHNAHENAQPLGYTPPSGPGLWQPTAPSFERALFPYWGNARTLAISATQKISHAPLTYNESNTSSFYTQAFEVRNLVANNEFKEEWIAEFWDDSQVGQTFGPVSRWLSITSQVVEKENANLETAVYTFAKLSIALNDATIATWHSKYVFNMERPVSYINRVMDPSWKPYFEETPNYPSYPSSHAVISAAAAEVLSHIYGYNFAVTDKSHEGRTEFLGMPRQYDTFYLMAEECALSRLYAGMNFRMDVEEGMRFGFEIGRKVNAMPFR